MLIKSNLIVSLEVTKDAFAVTKLIDLGFGSKIDDVYVTDDAEKPISGGLFEVKAHDAPFEYTYKYHELKYIISGQIDLKDKATGVTINGTAGDVIKIPKGTTVLFSSPSEGKAFYVGQRALRDF
ncbi:hypothetical protein MNV49_000976 [Pseudohyphozyma bogoriensis]|nr:hypothetical protein MNV49_000976 [Pseudohyphozyma bogoriensis]